MHNSDSMSLLESCRMLVDIDAEYIVESERIVRSNYDLSENMMG